MTNSLPSIFAPPPLIFGAQFDPFNFRPSPNFGAQFAPFNFRPSPNFGAQFGPFNFAPPPNPLESNLLPLIFAILSISYFRPSYPSKRKFQGTYEIQNVYS